jgi:hypothetical protein
MHWHAGLSSRGTGFHYSAAQKMILNISYLIEKLVTFHPAFGA